ncbi:hypothetical protein ASG90_00525 [Nocardioides sp. Soil797]|nr:hypothetical protein ASG90_00525 [Nocardioides sp. Soil797]
MPEASYHPSTAHVGGPPYAVSAPGEFCCPWPADLRGGLVVPMRVGSPGGPTEWQARGAGWRRTSRGFYVPAYVDGEVAEQRIVEASVVMPYGAAITAWAALRWQGAAWFDGFAPDGVTKEPLLILTGDHNIRSQAGFTVVEERRSLSDLRVVDGLLVTDPLRSLTHEMRYAKSVREASVAFSMAAYSDLVSAEEVCAHALTSPGWTGAPQLREACRYLEENAWSPWEQRTSLVWQIDAELPRALANRPVFDRFGNHLGTPDLIDEEAGLIIEYDGEVHLEPGRHEADLARLQRFRRAGLEFLIVRRGETAMRVTLAERMRRSRAAAAFAAPSKRNWTLEPPAWWVPTFTVQQRRELSDADRASLLRLRRRVS